MARIMLLFIVLVFSTNLLTHAAVAGAPPGNNPRLDGVLTSTVESEPPLVVERAEALGVPPPTNKEEGYLKLEDSGTDVVPPTAPITRVVEPQEVKQQIYKSNATKSKGLSTMEGLEEEIQVIGWTQPHNQYLGIGKTMTVEFLWTITRIDFNSTTALETIYLNPSMCSLRKGKFGGSSRCLFMPECYIGDHDVRKSLLLTEKGNYQVHYTVHEGDKAWGINTGEGLAFKCTFVEGSKNFTLAKDLHVGVLATRPSGTKATVIKPEKKKKVIVGDVITIEAELDRDGLNIVPEYCRVNTESEVNTIDLGRGLYTIDYVVKAGDPDRPHGKIPFLCTFEDAGGNNVTMGPLKLNTWFSINANPPEVQRVEVLSPKQSPARIGSIVTVRIKTKRRLEGLTLGSKCSLNAIDVSKSANFSNPGMVTLKLNVTSGQADWFAGKLPIDCQILDADGNAARITWFNDRNMLAGDAHTPRLSDYFPGLVLTVGFAFVCVASKEVAQYFPEIGMPLITGYLATGIVAGPEMLGLIPEQSIRQLRFIDEVSLAVIALTAGQKLYLPTMQSRFKSIGWVMLGLVIFEYAIGTATIFILHPYIHFMRHMDNNQITAVALMAGALVCARSPASAVAIVKELGAEGPFTSTVLGVTVLSDVVVIGLFALTSLFSNSLLANRSESQNVIYIFFVQIIASSLLGYILYTTLRAIIAILGKINDGSTGKSKFRSVESKFIVMLRAGLITFVSFSMFVVAHIVDPYIQPLIVCMVGGFIFANYSTQRQTLKRSLNVVTPAVYVAFFTLAGAALNLKSLTQTIMISSIIFGGRIVGILVGASFGGWMSGEPRKENKMSWMAYITQAGVTLGLAKKIHLENRTWGGGFATVIIACVVLNQISGPLLFRLVMQWVGEAGNMERRIEKIFWPGFGTGRSKNREHKRILILGEKPQQLVPQIQSLIDVHGNRVHSRVVGENELQHASILASVASVEAPSHDIDVNSEHKPLLAIGGSTAHEDTNIQLMNLLQGANTILVACGESSAAIGQILMNQPQMKGRESSFFIITETTEHGVKKTVEAVESSLF